mmetsp:Transcript_69424/g.165562  ORF Transcript_69424/g.165562 Transcript_69424/m.165562 type:complete len:309 (-) Transcript_69424:253-1179(-)
MSLSASKRSALPNASESVSPKGFAEEGGSEERESAAAEEEEESERSRSNFTFMSILCSRHSPLSASVSSALITSLIGAPFVTLPANPAKSGHTATSRCIEEFETLAAGVEKVPSSISLSHEYSLAGSDAQREAPSNALPRARVKKLISLSPSGVSTRRARLGGAIKSEGEQTKPCSLRRRVAWFWTCRRSSRMMPVARRSGRKEQHSPSKIEKMHVRFTRQKGGASSPGGGGVSLSPPGPCASPPRSKVNDCAKLNDIPPSQRCTSTSATASKVDKLPCATILAIAAGRLSSFGVISNRVAICWLRSV